MDASPDRRTRTVLAPLAEGPLTTSDLYDAVGYPTLVGLGLVPYAAFRAVLEDAAVRGLVTAGEDDDGATVWRLS